MSTFVLPKHTTQALRDLTFDSRLDSDYDIIFTPEQALVEAIQQDAQRFVKRAEQYLQQTGAL